MDQPPPISQKLKQARQSQGLSVIDLAKQSGWSRAYIYAVEKGHYTNPSIDRLKDIASALDVELGYFVEDA